MMPALSVLWLLGLLWAPVQAGLYGPEEPMVILDGWPLPPNVVLNSSSAWVVEYYASWCGHCQKFSSFWSALARDLQDWRPAVYLAVMDCADHSKSCTKFKVTAYPTIKFFKAFSKNLSSATRIKHSTDEDAVAIMRRQIIENLEQQKESWPPACPPLEPASVEEIQGFFESNNVDYLALIFEDETSFLGREVTMDMLQFENIAVRRVLPSEALQMPNYNVKTLPAAYLLERKGTFSRIKVTKEDRSSYSSFLRSLSAVRRGIFPLIGQSKPSDKENAVVWKQADSSKVYRADLESALSYTLRSEVAKFTVLEGEKLAALQKYISLLAQCFPARPMGKTLLQALDSYLKKVTEPRIAYSDFEAVLNNQNSNLEAVLMPDSSFVWCQGTEPRYRGFPCSLWTMFHVLTVQCADGVEVVTTMRNYIKNFFGCRECAKHFEGMAAESIGNVTNHNQAIMWLWARHNQVNIRLAGAPSEDPKYPKLLWPIATLCPLCLTEYDGKYMWDTSEVLHFLKAHYTEKNIVDDYLPPESKLLENQRAKEQNGPRGEKREVEEEGAIAKETLRKKRDVLEHAEGEEGDEVNQQVVSKTQRVKKHKRPTIVRVISQSKDDVNTIIDLDNYKKKAPQAASAMARQKRHANVRMLQSQLEEDRLPDFDYAVVRERLRKSGAGSKYLMGVSMEEENVYGRGTQRHWYRTIELGFSRLDLSLCIVLYIISSLFLFAMYLYFHMKSRMCKHKPPFPFA